MMQEVFTKLRTLQDILSRKFEVERDILAAVRENACLVSEDRAIGSSHGHDDWRAFGIDLDPFLVRTIPQLGRDKAGVEDRPVLRFDHQSVQSLALQILGTTHASPRPAPRVTARQTVPCSG